MFETEAVCENYELGVVAGEAREQQRIIALLAKDAPIWESESLGKDLIALIKGEK